VGDREIQIEVMVTSEQHWFLNDKVSRTVAGCVDLDLNFSPCTNLLPIRRLELAVGQGSQVNAAWLRFPSFRLEPLPQVYRRVAATTYHYESHGGLFATELKVNETGFVTQYPNFWERDEGGNSSLNR
jgi:hypothetical protein